MYIIKIVFCYIDFLHIDAIVLKDYDVAFL